MRCCYATPGSSFLHTRSLLVSGYSWRISYSNICTKYSNYFEIWHVLLEETWCSWPPIKPILNLDSQSSHILKSVFAMERITKCVCVLWVSQSASHLRTLKNWILRLTPYLHTYSVIQREPTTENKRYGFFANSQAAIYPNSELKWICSCWFSLFLFFLIYRRSLGGTSLLLTGHPWWWHNVMLADVLIRRHISSPTKSDKLWGRVWSFSTRALGNQAPALTVLHQWWCWVDTESIHFLVTSEESTNASSVILIARYPVSERSKKTQEVKWFSPILT